MRVLMTTDTVGGVWTYTLELARGLRGLGADVVLATMGPALRDDQRDQAEGAGLAALHESGYALEWMQDPWPDVDAAGDWVAGLAREECADVVHSCSYSHGTVRFGRPVVVVAHSCVFSWWRAVKGEAPPPGWDEYRRRISDGLRAADAVVAPTAAMLAELRRDYGFTSGLVIPNGSASGGDAAGQHPDSGREPFVLAAGRLLDPAKGLDVLDLAAAGLAWPVVAAGPDAAASNVRTLGRLSHAELARLQRRAAIFVAPARYEPFGLGILEAARSGCALVLSDIASLRELWADAAAFVPAGDPAALRDALARLIDDAGECARLARAARMRAARFSVDRMARSYRALYERITSAEQQEMAA